jgi:hypothetical protein
MKKFKIINCISYTWWRHEPLARDNRIKYYLMAIKLNESNSMYKLAFYYEENED